jgi:glycosyltransferase involved in cell wall biosynthesis
MACGTPVAASQAGSLPEVCGDAAVLFDPDSPGAIAEGIASALDHAGELSLRGIEHARTFTWDAAATRHEHVYRSTRTGSE